jgi:hypothetical protein
MARPRKLPVNKPALEVEQVRYWGEKMKRSEKIEWLLRIATFGSALAVGIIAAWSIWVAFRIS